MTAPAPRGSSRPAPSRKWLVQVGRAEGLSFIALLGIAMPLKYLAGEPGAVRYVGWIHGMLFIAYLMALGVVAQDERWSLSRIFAGLCASVLPLGTFVFEAKVLKGTERA